MKTKTGWDDITIADLIKIKEIGSLQLATEDEKNLKVAALVNDIPYEQLIQVPLSQIRTYMDATDFLLTEPKARKVKNHYTINGRKYKLLKNEMDLLTSQYIDFQSVQQDGFDKRPAELLSVMIVPEGHTYNDGYDKDLVIEDMYDMSVTEALGIIDFFTRRFRRSIAWAKTLCKVKMRWARLTARKENREMYKALELQMNLILDEASSIFGSLVWRR